ncbi:hypothetical protein STENM223S_00286 [Streptomyces tendae]
MELRFSYAFNFIYVPSMMSPSASNLAYLGVTPQLEISACCVDLC